MKILHVIASIDPSHGGPSLSAPSLAAAQAKLGYEVSLAYNCNYKVDSELHRRMMLDYQKIVPDIELLKTKNIFVNGIGERYLGNASAREIKKFIDDIDIVHIHGTWDPIVVRTAIIAYKSKKHYVLTPRGMLNPWSLKQKRFKKELMLKLIVNSILAKSAFVHALNSTEAKSVSDVCKGCEVKIFPNGFFKKGFETMPIHGNFSRDYTALKNRPYILFLGRLHLVKGLDYVAEAFGLFAKQEKNIDLVVAGPDEGAKREFLNSINALGIRERVHLIGPIYGDRKYSAIRDAVCFLQPSRQEGFSMAITEALACGTPVVISENCHFPEVGKAGAGEVVPLNAKNICEALLRVCLDSEKREKMGFAARDLVMKNYTWENIAKDMIKAYNRVIKV